MSEKDHYKFGLSKRGKNVNDNNTLADDLRERIAALEARCDAARKLLEPLAECDPAIREWLGMQRWPIRSTDG